jgi:hypothetical protein
MWIKGTKEELNKEEVGRKNRGSRKEELWKERERGSERSR